MARNYADKNIASVTQILGAVLRKPGLEWWFKVNSQEFCDEQSSKGREIGHTVHEIIQAHIEETEFEIETDYPLEVQYAVKSFFKFKKEHPEIKLKRAEMPVISELNNYQGTLDCLAEEVKLMLLLDWTTGECKVGTKKEVEVPTIYPEKEYQATAYVKAYNEMQGKDVIKKAGVLSIAKDKVAYNFITLSEQKMNEIFDRVFLPCVSIYYYQKENENGKYSERSRTGSFAEGSRKLGTKGAKLPGSF